MVGCTTSVGDDDEGRSANLSVRSSPSAAEAKACEKGTVGVDGTGAKVVHCTKPFATAPFIRLPDDNVTATNATFYGGITVPTTAANESVLWTRDGDRYLVVDGDASPIPFGSKLPSALHAPTNRVTFTLYQFKGKVGAQVDTAFGKAKTIRLTSARSVVMVDGCAFDVRLAGTWTGTVSERLTTPQGYGSLTKNFDESKRVPIHLTLETVTKSKLLQDYKHGTAIADAVTYKLSGTIDNFDQDVTVGGKTYPSLTAMGKKNPFYGAANGDVELYRLGNMHGLTNDGHWVFTYPASSNSLTVNGMSYDLTSFTAPTMLFDEGTSNADLQSVTIKPHIPFTVNGHSIILTPENVGTKLDQCH